MARPLVDGTAARVAFAKLMRARCSFVFGRRQVSGRRIGGSPRTCPRTFQVVTTPNKPLSLHHRPLLTPVLPQGNFMNALKLLLALSLCFIVSGCGGNPIT